MKGGSSGFLEKIVPSEILQVKPYVPGKPIEEVKRELGLSKVIKLASNENPLGPSPEAVEAICRYASQVHLYPDGDCYYLKRELALHLEVEPDNIILGNGSDEIVSILTRVFIQEGKEAIMGYPSFLMYKIDTQLARGKIICVPLNDFKIDIDAIIKAINSNTRIIFISNPNNPTGTIVTREKMQELVENIPPWVLVVCDEAYYEYVEDSLYPDSLRWVKEGKNVVVLRTFSKIYGLAGLRIGYGVARKEIISILNRARPPFNVNLLAQVAARASLKDKKHLLKSKNLIKEEKKFLYTKLKELGVEFVPSQTNFILIRTGNKTEEIINNLLKKGIIVRGMQAYNLPDYIRLTIGTREENEFFIQEFRKTFR
ncbi:histidinol-phosphate transaminase [Candidatus Aerophobetes bacterium]|nr:histidinol-phosphate transaminase [Candidatus Aerophobetes bacterium]